MNELSPSLPEQSSFSDVLTPEAQSAITELVGLETQHVNDHVDVFERIHTSLRAALHRPAAG